MLNRSFTGNFWAKVNLYVNLNDMIPILLGNAASLVSHRFPTFAAPLSFCLSRSLGLQPVRYHNSALSVCTTSMTKRAAADRSPTAPAPEPKSKSNRKRKSTPEEEVDAQHQAQEQRLLRAANKRAAASSEAHDPETQEVPTPAKKAPKRRPPTGSRKKAHDQVSYSQVVDHSCVHICTHMHMCTRAHVCQCRHCSCLFRPPCPG